jgi:signal transduction histidine kinase
MIDADALVLRRSALRIAVHVAVISALLVCSIFGLVVGFLWFQSLRPEALEPHRGDIRFALDPLVLIFSLGSVGTFSIVLAGIASWLIARRATRPIGDALRVQRNFVSDASHELRTPLTVLSARVQQLERVIDEPARRERVLADLRRDTRSLSDIVDDLLVSATLRDEDAAGGRAELGDALDWATDAMQLLADRRAVTVDVERAEALVALSTTALRRCLTVLVDNAIAHSSAGDVVRVRVRTDRRNVTIDVSDSGPGISGIAPERVFERFAHGTPTTIDPSHRTGFGIGLALVEEIVVLHHGRVWVESTSPEGTTFSLRIPLAHGDH